eukprot:scaffold284112_cov28-Tisochrysis_lutea.AAC.2
MAGAASPSPPRAATLAAAVQSARMSRGVYALAGNRSHTCLWSRIVPDVRACVWRAIDSGLLWCMLSFYVIREGPLAGLPARDE